MPLRERRGTKVVLIIFKYLKMIANLKRKSWQKLEISLNKTHTMLVQILFEP